MTTLGHVLEERVVRCPTLTPIVDVVPMRPSPEADPIHPRAATFPARLTGTGPHGQ